MKNPSEILDNVKGLLGIKSQKEIVSTELSSETNTPEEEATIEKEIEVANQEGIVEEVEMKESSNEIEMEITDVVMEEEKEEDEEKEEMEDEKEDEEEKEEELEEEKEEEKDYKALYEEALVEIDVLKAQLESSDEEVEEVKPMEEIEMSQEIETISHSPEASVSKKPLNVNLSNRILTTQDRVMSMISKLK